MPMTNMTYIDERTSDLAKQHARDVLENQDTEFDEEISDQDLHNTRVLAGYKATMHSKFVDVYTY